MWGGTKKKKKKKPDPKQKLLFLFRKVKRQFFEYITEKAFQAFALQLQSTDGDYFTGWGIWSAPSQT